MHNSCSLKIKGNQMDQKQAEAAIQEEIVKVQKIMSESKTGIAMLEKSYEMSTSDPMVKLMELLGDDDFPEAERSQIAGYMGQLMQEQPTDGLEQFAQYLEDLITKPEYINRDGYYAQIADAARSLGASEVYKAYITAYNNFTDDNSESAVAAKKANEDFQKKMQEVSQAAQQG